MGARVRRCKNPLYATVHTPLQIRTNKHRCFVFCLGHTSLASVPGIGRKNKQLLNEAGIEDLATLYAKYRQINSVQRFQYWLERDIGFTTYQAKMTTCGIGSKLGEIKEINTGLTPVCCPRMGRGHEDQSAIPSIGKGRRREKRSVLSEEEHTNTGTEMKRIKSERSSWASSENLSPPGKQGNNELSSALQTSFSSESVVSDRWRPDSTLSYFSEDQRERSDRVEDSQTIRPLCDWKSDKDRIAWYVTRHEKILSSRFLFPWNHRTGVDSIDNSPRQNAQKITKSTTVDGIKDSHLISPILTDEGLASFGKNRSPLSDGSQTRSPNDSNQLVSRKINVEHATPDNIRARAKDETDPIAAKNDTRLLKPYDYPQGKKKVNH